MKAIATLSRSKSVDYKNNDWQIQNSSASQADIDNIQFFIDQNARLGGECHFVVSRASDICLFDVLLAVEVGKTDVRNRKIAAFVVYFGLDEVTARKLIASALRETSHSRSLHKDIAAAFAYDETIEKYGWRSDYSLLSDILNKDYVQSVEIDLEAKVFNDAWELDNTESARAKLAREISENGFSKTLGAKIVVTGQPSTDFWKRGQMEADRLLWKGAVETDLIELRKKKQQEATSTKFRGIQKSKSERLSDPSRKQKSRKNLPNMSQKSPEWVASSTQYREAFPIILLNGLLTWLSRNWKWVLPVALIWMTLAACPKKKGKNSGQMTTPIPAEQTPVPNNKKEGKQATPTPEISR